MKKIFFSLTIILLLSFLYNQDKLRFSADTAQSSKNDNTLTKVFKDNVKIEDGEMTLYTDLAIEYPDLNKVILTGNVRMYEYNDSLSCNEFTLYKGDNERYQAYGDVILYKQEKEIKAQKLIYFNESNEINATNNVTIQDSSILISGDSLYINYKDSLINQILITSNVELFKSQYLYLKDYNEKKLLQDKMESNNAVIDFNDNEEVDLVSLSGMAIGDFTVVKDSLIKGINHISGDTILIKFDDDLVSNMNISGGVIGEFVPDKSNKNVKNKILYIADNVNYDLDNEITVLTDNAKVVYGETTLEGGEIEANLKNNIVESKIKDSILPSVSTNDGEPTYGEYMLFDLATEEGNINKGYNTVDIGIFKGEEFIIDNNEDVYIQNGTFTSCDLPVPHYHFGSKKMKLVNDKKQIISKAMVLYIQDFPALTLPFTVLPNSNARRKSGFIMPTFGHSSETGTWIEDFGYYYAPNDYYDVLTTIDFYDKKKVIIDSDLTYKKLYGDNWYDYKFSGFLYLNNYIRELIGGNQDFTDLCANPPPHTADDLCDNSLVTRNYSAQFEHLQDFDIGHYIRINYEYYNYETIDETNNSFIENDITKRLDQTEKSNLFYSKNWDLSYITLGVSSNRYLAIPDPEYLNQTYSYKMVQEPILNYKYHNPTIFGSGDNWYNKTKLSYSSTIYHKYLTYSKIAIIKNDSIQWSDDASITTIKPGAIHNIKLNLPLKIKSFTLTPNIILSEQWALSDNMKEINGRKINGTLGVNLQTTLYGIFSLKSSKVSAIRHTITPIISTTYQSKSKFIKGSFEDFEETYSQIRGLSYSSIATSSISINNLFQAKVLSDQNEYIKRNIMGLNFSTNYNWHSKLFSLLVSSISLKNSMGGEYLHINMEHSLYKNDSTADLIDITKGEFPRLMALTTSISRTFKYGISGESFNDESQNINANNQKADDITNNIYPTTDNMTNNPNESELNNKLWDASFGFTLTARYNLIDKWNLEYSKLSINSGVNLSKEWSMNNIIYINLDDMKVSSYEMELKRSLHCWDFFFIMKPIGYNKGFGLRISISEDKLKFKMTQSTMKGNWDS